MKKRIMGLFGKVKIPMAWCDECKEYAFVVDRKIQCCDCNVILSEDEKKNYVRFSGGTGRRTRLSEKRKKSILKEQGYLCIYCGVDLRNEKIHFDHLVPFSFDHTTTDPDNMVAACACCNLLKSDKMYESTQEVWDDIKERRQKRVKELPGVPKGFLAEAGMAKILQPTLPIFCLGQEKPKNKRKRLFPTSRKIKIPETEKRTCPVCNKAFVVVKGNRKRKYCTGLCATKIVREKAYKKYHSNKPLGLKGSSEP